MVQKERSGEMSIVLRILLIIASIIMISIVVLRIRKSKFQIHDGLFWFLLSLLFLVLSVFPQIATWLSDMIGIESPANLIFLCILTLLLIRSFMLSVKISLLEYNLMKLTQKVVIEEKDDKGGDKGTGPVSHNVGKEENVEQ